VNEVGIQSFDGVEMALRFVLKHAVNGLSFAPCTGSSEPRNSISYDENCAQGSRQA
jgi:hypothetical protein